MAFAIETHELTRSFGKRLAVENLSLNIPHGTVFGFLGPNGAGKTTTVRMLTSLIAPTSGTALVNGHRLGEEDAAIRRSVGILTESPGLYDRLTATQNLVFFAQLYEVSEQKARSQAEHYLRALDLWERRDDKVGGFSKGMRQKLALARAFMHEPAVVFLDEPTSGLDPEAARTVRNFVGDLRSEGRTIFLTTHNLPEADELCDLIGVFQTRLLQTGTPAALRASLFGRGTVVRIAGDATPWVESMEALPFVKSVQAENGALSVNLDDPAAQNPLLIEALVGKGAQIQYVEPLEHSLEDVYLQLLEGSERK
ncbi:MAG TPA: ABC transporter ATP-binding protein [Chloroflexia bacterium]|nr:ABC transporter ATP-binding protein [Chloroflexia bacterium]